LLDPPVTTHHCRPSNHSHLLLQSCIHYSESQNQRQILFTKQRKEARKQKGKKLLFQICCNSESTSLWASQPAKVSQRVNPSEKNPKSLIHCFFYQTDSSRQVFLLVLLL
jgi:hypothetical protein